MYQLNLPGSSKEVETNGMCGNTGLVSGLGQIKSFKILSTGSEAQGLHGHQSNYKGFQPVQQGGMEKAETEGS